MNYNIVPFSHCSFELHLKSKVKINGEILYKINFKVKIAMLIGLVAGLDIGRQLPQVNSVLKKSTAFIKSF